MPALRRQWTDTVDRELFIPEIIWVQREAGAPLTPLSRSAEPGEWHRLVASDEPLVTQVADGWLPVSSSTGRPIMNLMLNELGLRPGIRVLEIGTGTGWNAAIMAEAGAEVTTIEIDPRVAGRARRALDDAGYRQVRVVCGDGEAGWPEGSPYDALIATAAAHTIPYPWVAQTRVGGRLVVPYCGPRHPRGLAVLTVRRGGVAWGRIVDDNAPFMALRGQWLSPPQLRDIGEPEPGLTIEVRATGQRVRRVPVPGLHSPRTRQR